MAKDVQLFSSKLPAIGTLKSALETARRQAPSSTGALFLRLARHGEWIYGPDSVPVADNSRFALNTLSLSHGWIAWEDGAVQDEQMVSVFQQPELPPQPDSGFDWQRQWAVLAQGIEGDDAGVALNYKGSSSGIRGAMGLLFDAVLKQADEAPTLIFPVVKLEMSSYQHKQYGRIFVPVLTIERWVDVDGKGSRPRITRATKATKVRTRSKATSKKTRKARA